MSTPAKRVLLTGAAGTIGSQLVPALREAFDLRMVDVKDTDRQGQRLEGVELFDLVESSDAEVTELFSGVEAIVHCGHQRPIGEDGYASERRNVDLMERIYRLGMAAGVRRVVAASTNQASKWYEQPWFEGRIDRVTPDDYPRPDTFYGWAKVAYESLGFLYACGSLGQRLEVVQIRIVAPREIDAAAFEDRPLRRYLRDITGYISQRDLQQLFVRSVDAESVDDPYGVPFQIFYGVSNNARTFWSITNAREVIGYAPQDDSEIAFADDISRMIARG
jgi:NAD+ dependent glucose-6-phosphate dehydrogenase